jgi:hypothetical protein
MKEKRERETREIDETREIFSFFACFVYFACFAFSLGYVSKAQQQKLSEAYDEPSQIGTITSPSVAEISGITPSRTARGLWWIHNDSGDQARLYVINSSGKLLGRYTVTGARNRDWEDMEGFMGKDGKPMLYIGDFGNNSLKRDDLTIYRVKEPDLSKSTGEGVTEAAESLPFRYPDSKHDAEALFIDPNSGRPYIVTKTFSPPCGVYRFPMPLRPNVRVTLEKMDGRAVEEISKLFLVTGAATSPDGNRIIVRTYFGALEMVRSKGGPFETIFKSVPEPTRLPRERQGEAITYTPDGKSLVTTSEKIPAPIFKISRK